MKRKQRATSKNHGVTFEEAATVLKDKLSLTMNDIAHSIGEECFIDIGLSSSGQILVVTYTERGNNIRIINCRKATSAERKAYETQNN
jgi:uncharacterized DUF497 family protein